MRRKSETRGRGAVVTAENSEADRNFTKADIALPTGADRIWCRGRSGMKEAPYLKEPPSWGLTAEEFAEWEREAAAAGS